MKCLCAFRSVSIDQFHLMKCQIYQTETNLPLMLVNNDNWNRPFPAHQNEAKLNYRPEIAIGICTLQAGSGCKYA